VQVQLNRTGCPAEFALGVGGVRRAVIGLDEQWREERHWWDLTPVRRDYYRVLLSDGSFCNLFQDLVSGEWYLDRAWPVL
jgi:hypothetical protein